MRFAHGKRRWERTEMNELKTLEARLKSATDRISAALSTVPTGGTSADENAELRQKLDDLKAQRVADLKDLDELLEHLRPLMEGTENA